MLIMLSQIAKIASLENWKDGETKISKYSIRIKETITINIKEITDYY